MKKFFFIAAMVSAALISCTKNEPAPSVDAQQEITFMTAPLTKATALFDTNKKFISYAYLLTDGNVWNATNAPAAKPYIENKLIEYITANNYWANADAVYYWPKDEGSSLTFFAWTDNTDAPAASGKQTAICSNELGIHFVDYDVTAIKNRDILVADIAEDQIKNTTATGSWESGVPTVFYHILSQMKLNIKLAKEYSGVKFHLNKIEVVDVATQGEYRQGIDVAKTPTEGVWIENATPINDLPLYSATGGMDVTAHTDYQTVTPSDKDYTILLPQTFAAGTEKVRIEYTITTEYAGTPVEETVIVEEELINVFPANWLAGKYYTLNITLGLEQILWDPAVEDWTAGSSYDWAI